LDPKVKASFINNEEELPYIDAKNVTPANHARGWLNADNVPPSASQNTFVNKMRNLNDRVGWVIGGAKKDGAGWVDMDHLAAQAAIQKEYENALPITRPLKADYRLLTYYTPYLNLFPEGTKAGWTERHEMADLHGVGLRLNLPPPEDLLPLPPCEATLQVLYDIKDFQPDRITLEYDAEYLQITLRTTTARPPIRTASPGNGAPPPGTPIPLPSIYASPATPPAAPETPPGKKELILTENNKPARGTPTPPTYAGNVAKRAEITIKCVKAIPPGNTEVSVWTYDCGSKQQAGKLIVMANGVARQKRMKIALVTVTTDLMQIPQGPKTGAYGPKELVRLYHILHQALIIPDVVNTFSDEGISHEITLDLSQDRAFQAQPASAAPIPPTKLKNGVLEGPPAPGQYVRPATPAVPATPTAPGVPAIPECIQPDDNLGFGYYIRKCLDERYPKLFHQFHLAFKFAEDGRMNDSLGGVTSTVPKKATDSPRELTCRSLCSIYNSPDNAMLAHELLHTLQVFHPHLDDTSPLLTAQKYVFPRGTTTNIMAYNFNPGAGISTWKWQWEIMQENAEKVIW
jgi:hypothetical protein